MMYWALCTVSEVNVKLGSKENIHNISLYRWKSFLQSAKN